MELHKDSWYVRWFFWSLKIVAALYSDSRYRPAYDSYRVRERDGTNLCFFIRVVALYAPAILLLQLALWLAAIGSVTVLPVSLFGWTWYAVIIGSIAALVLVIVGLVFFFKKREQWKEERVREMSSRANLTEEPAEDDSLAAGPPPPPTFMEVLWVYAKAVKEKVCPRVTFIAKEIGNE